MADVPNIQGILIGGGLTLAGTVLSQAVAYWVGWRERENKRKLIQLDRLEKIVGAVTESLKWFESHSRLRTLEDISSHPPPLGARQAAMLAQLYFSELVDPAAKYTNSLVDYHHLLIDCFDPKIPASATAQVLICVRNDPSLKMRSKAHFDARIALDAAIAREAKKYR